MAEEIRLSAAVMFVRNLNRSVAFYQEVIGLRVTDTSTTAALLAGGDGTQLVLRATGENSPHPLGQVGIQYLAWMVPSKDDLDHRADLLRRRGGFQDTRSDSGVTVVEGRDPDDVVVMLIHAEAGRAGMRELPARIYAW
jgi:catechol-2,3-dioxygenase